MLLNALRAAHLNETNLKMRVLLLLVIVVMMTGCVSTSHVPAEIADEIPRNATSIRITSDQPPDEYYRTIYRELASRGYTIAQENEEMGTLATGPKDIGQETTLSIAVFVQPEGEGSSATFRGVWGITGSLAAGFSFSMGMSTAGGTSDPAKWGPIGRPSAAFGELAIVANRIPHSDIRYLTD